MELGKIDYKLIKDIFTKIGSEFSLDSNFIKWEYGKDIIVSTNPALGVPLETLGFFAFHYSVSNIVASMGKPLYILDSILLPPGTNSDVIQRLVNDILAECKKYSVRLVGGHSGFYYGIETPVVNVTTLGIRVREHTAPEVGDCIVLMGRYGRESLWLASLVGLADEKYLGIWRELTPVPKALFALQYDNVRVLHDVSEGGLARALLDIVKRYGLGIKVSLKNIDIEEEIYNIVESNELYSIPNFGVLVAIVDSLFCEEFLAECNKKGFECYRIGSLTKDKQLVIDGSTVLENKRTRLDYVYGVIDTLDPVVNRLFWVLRNLVSHKEITKLIPEVGLNIVFGKSKIESLDDIAGLSGRVVKSLGRPKVCGKVVYGGSRHLSNVLYIANRIDKSIRSCVNIIGDDNIFEILQEKIGLKVKMIEGFEKAVCPVSEAIKKDRKIYDAYFHIGGFGIEPSIVILGKYPEELLNILVRVAQYV